jgi:hypothetical protein
VEIWALLIPILGVVFGLGIVLATIWSDHKKDMALIEKGLYTESRRDSHGRNALVWGLILTLVGIALVIAWAILGNRGLVLPGLIGAAIGIALLVYAFIIRRDKAAGPESRN